MYKYLMETMRNINTQTTQTPLQALSANIPTTGQHKHTNGKIGEYTIIPSILSAGKVEIIGEIHSLGSARTPRWLRAASFMIVCMLAILILFLIFVPW
jgi:hypothetical protein